MTLEQYVVRIGELKDAGALLALWREAGAVPSATDDRESVERLIRHDPAAVLVACHEGRLVGSLIAAWDGWRGNMYRLAVAPSHRRRGIARRLVEEGEARLRRNGATRITALLVAEHDAAMAFWETAGYTWDRRMARFVKGAT